MLLKHNFNRGKSLIWERERSLINYSLLMNYSYNCINVIVTWINIVQSKLEESKLKDYRYIYQLTVNPKRFSWTRKRRRVFPLEFSKGYSRFQLRGGVGSFNEFVDEAYIMWCAKRPSSPSLSSRGDANA